MHQYSDTACPFAHKTQQVQAQIQVNNYAISNYGVSAAAETKAGSNYIQFGTLSISVAGYSIISIINSPIGSAVDPCGAIWSSCGGVSDTGDFSFYN